MILFKLYQTGSLISCWPLPGPIESIIDCDISEDVDDEDDEDDDEDDEDDDEEPVFGVFG